MSSERKGVLALAIAVLVVISGVGVYLVTARTTGTVRVAVYAGDLPGDWTHMNVTFSQVRIHAALADNESGWRNLTLSTKTVDLAQLTNMSELLAVGNVSAGKYTQIRLVVVSVKGMMADGVVVGFRVPSGELKTTNPFNVSAGHTETLTLNLDMSHSIVHNDLGWIFKPVLGSISSS